MKKFFPFLLLSLFPLISVSAWDEQLTLNNVSAFSHVNSSDWTSIQSNQAVFSLSSPISSWARFETQAAFSFLDSNNNPYAVPNLPVPNMTLDFLSFSFSGTTQLGKESWGNWFVGRGVQSDLTGWILNSRVDGASLNWQFGKQRLGFQGYYTGLVATQNSLVQVSTQDYVDSSSYYSWGSSPLIFQFAPKRAIGMLDYRYAELFARQDLNLQVLGQWDLRSTGDVHTFYYTAELSGPISPINYALYVTASTLVGPVSTGWSALGGARVIWNFPDTGWTAQAEGLYTRRLTTNAADGFVPVSERGPSLVLSTLSLWNVAEAGLGASFRPASHAELGLKVDSLFQTTSENQNLNGAGANGVYQAVVQNLDPNNTQPYLGTEGTFYGSWNFTSEWSLGITAAGFLPSGAFTDRNVIWLAALAASLKI